MISRKKDKNVKCKFIKKYSILLFFLLIIKCNLIINGLINLISEENSYLQQIKDTFAFNYVNRFKTDLVKMPNIYIITPTKPRLTQMADLIRMRNTLQMVPKLHWVLVEDSEKKSERIANFLKESGIKYHHMAVKSPWTTEPKRFTFYRGSIQRNMALKWIQSLKQNDITIYFGDDDNSYDLQLFEEIRNTKRISIQPIALVGGLYYEKPVCQNFKVVDYFFYYRKERKYPCDMGSFAFNISLIKKFPNAQFPVKYNGYLEQTFLQNFKIPLINFEPKASMCSQLYVWHSKTIDFVDKHPENNEHFIEIQI